MGENSLSETSRPSTCRGSLPPEAVVGPGESAAAEVEALMGVVSKDFSQTAEVQQNRTVRRRESR